MKKEKIVKCPNKKFLPTKSKYNRKINEFVA